MKSRRNFVVELKSSRRQTKPQNRSIWGDTDLKALASEVEANLPVSRVGRGTSLALEKRSKQQPIPGSESGGTRSSSDTLTGDKLTQTPSMPRILQALPQAAVEPQANPVQEETDRTPARRVSSSEGSDDENEKKQSNSISAKPQVPGTDELAVLEAENHRLKAMLGLQLRVENHELRKMLARLP